MPPEFKAVFAAAEKGDWQTVTNSFGHVARQAMSQNKVEYQRLRGVWWQPAMEVCGAFEQFAPGDERYEASGRGKAGTSPEAAALGSVAVSLARRVYKMTER